MATRREPTPEREPLTLEQRVLSAAAMYAAYCVVAGDQTGWMKRAAEMVDVPAEQVAELLAIDVATVEAIFGELESDGLMQSDDPPEQA